jgi:hypothetical protein
MSLDDNSLIFLFVTVSAIIGLGIITNQRQWLRHSILAILGIAMIGYFSNVPALAALENSDRQMSQEQRVLEENLKLTPDGGHYSGIEYAERTTGAQKPVNDDTIQNTIEAYTSDNVIVAVANGSVRLSGRVKNKEVAQHIVDQTKTIPGVHEITFNLGLDNKAS